MAARWSLTNMVEFFVDEPVRFAPRAEVSERVRELPAKVKGYEEIDGVDYVVVSVRGKPPCEQWVLPHEIEPTDRRLREVPAMAESEDDDDCEWFK